MAEIHRSELKNASYNPRVLNDSEKAKLRAGLKKHGSVAPITWNKRTGNIVGGHQRTSQLDALAGTKDYTLTVAVVDIDEKSEKELNVILNNPNAQGAWDLSKLSDLLRDPTLNLGNMGFDTTDVYKMFGDQPLMDRGAAALDEMAQRVREARERYSYLKENNDKGATGSLEENFYIVVVFKDEEECTAFLAEHRLEDNRYHSGVAMQRLIKGEDAPEARAESPSAQRPKK